MTLEQGILDHITQGYRLIFRDASSAQLVKQKRLEWWLSLPVAIGGPFIGALALLLYAPLGVIIIALSSMVMTILLLIYLDGHDECVFLYYREDGQVNLIRR